MLSEAENGKYGLLVSPDAAVQACMLGAVFASQRLRIFSAAIVQQCMRHESLQRAKGPPQTRNKLQEPNTHERTAVEEAKSRTTAASSTRQRTQMRSAATAAAEALPASTPELSNVLARQQGFEARPGSPPACSAAAALTAEGKQSAQHSVTMLKKMFKKLEITLQNAQVQCHACYRKESAKVDLRNGTRAAIIFCMVSKLA